MPPLGCEAAPKPVTAVYQTHRDYSIHDCFAAERGQAPSPHGSFPQEIGGT
ncbi:hypothetical protein EMIT0215P_150011 [Pseudomonas serboccidentalis]